MRRESSSPRDDVGIAHRGHRAACDGRLRARGLRAQATLDGAEIEILYDLIAARHALTVLVHAWRSRTIRRELVCSIAPP